jgi:Mg-chelatase subunit ChlD/uncharacterized coiled-coil protein SlyX
MTRQTAQTELGERNKALEDVQSQAKANQLRISELEGKGAAGVSQKLTEALVKVAELEEQMVKDKQDLEATIRQLDTVTKELADAQTSIRVKQQEQSDREKTIGNLLSELNKKESVERDASSLAQNITSLTIALAGKNEEIASLKKVIDRKKGEIADLTARAANARVARRNSENRIRQELSDKGQEAATDVLGFRGRFRNVVFIVDISRSMTHINDPEKAGYEFAKYNPARWNKTKREIVSWARNLPMQTLRLVLFHYDVWEYPDEGEHFSMVSLDRDDSVTRIEGILEQVTPDGQTNTPGAFEKAYGYSGVDTIILFTDGNPMVDGRSSEELIATVRELVRKHRHIPVNVVGIGEYFEKSFADFLRDIANTTGGEFIGR